jgi:hypothetical protein
MRCRAELEREDAEGILSALWTLPTAPLAPHDTFTGPARALALEMAVEQCEQVCCCVMEGEPIGDDDFLHLVSHAPPQVPEVASLCISILLTPPLLPCTLLITLFQETLLRAAVRVLANRPDELLRSRLKRELCFTRLTPAALADHVAAAGLLTDSELLSLFLLRHTTDEAKRAHLASSLGQRRSVWSH